MSPISTSSQSSIGGAGAAAPSALHGHEPWTNTAAALPQPAGYDSYFNGVQATQAEHAVYHKPYHMS